MFSIGHNKAILQCIEQQEGIFANEVNIAMSGLPAFVQVKAQPIGELGNLFPQRGYVSNKRRARLLR